MECKKLTLKTVVEAGAYKPTKAHNHDAGFDLRAPVNVTVQGHSAEIVGTGVHILIPPGYVGFIKSKSGLAVNFDIVSDAGVIDADYTGEIKLRIKNEGNKPVVFHAGDKIAQLVLCTIPDAECVLVDSLDDTDRGANGFGSSGR